MAALFIAIIILIPIIILISIALCFLIGLEKLLEQYKERIILLEEQVNELIGEKIYELKAKN